MPDLAVVYAELRRRLSVHEDAFLVSDNLTDANTAASRKVDEPSPDTYVLLGAPTERYPDGQLFASVRIGKRYVSYHLMSVYMSPEGPSIGPELTRRRQGKSCFNFTRVDDTLFDELADLTDRGRDLYEAEGLLRR